MMENVIGAIVTGFACLIFFDAILGSYVTPGFKRFVAKLTMLVCILAVLWIIYSSINWDALLSFLMPGLCLFAVLVILVFIRRRR